MKKEQIKCPSCSSFKTIDTRSTYIGIGIFMTILFLPSLLFISLIFPIVLVLAGILVLAMGLMVKEDVRMKCQSCNFLFPKEKQL